MSLSPRPAPGWFRDLPDGMREVADCPLCTRKDVGLTFTHPGVARVVQHHDPRAEDSVHCYGAPIALESVRLVADDRQPHARRVLSHRRNAARL